MNKFSITTEKNTNGIGEDAYVARVILQDGGLDFGAWAHGVDMMAARKRLKDRINILIPQLQVLMQQI